MQNVYKQFQTQGSSADGQVPLFDFTDLTQLMGFEDIWEFEKRFGTTK